MRVLVVGARGFVGAELTKDLLARGHSVVAVDVRADPGRLAPVADQIEWRIGDCSSLEFMLKAIGKDGVDAIYYGPFYRPPHGVRDLETEFEIMGSGALQVFDLARALDVKRIIFPSSTAVHGVQPPGVKAVNEDSYVRPNGVYGATKLLCERMAEVINDELGRNVIACIRLPSVYGPGADIASRRANVFAVQAARGLSGEVFYRPETPICIAHVADTARLLTRIIEADSIEHTVYGLGGITVTFDEIASAVRRLVPSADLRFGSDTVSPLASAVDWSRAREEFGLSHQDLDQGMRSIVEYELAKRRGVAA